MGLAVVGSCLAIKVACSSDATNSDTGGRTSDVSSILYRNWSVYFLSLPIQEVN